MHVTAHCIHSAIIAIIVAARRIAIVPCICAVIVGLVGIANEAVVVDHIIVGRLDVHTSDIGIEFISDDGIVFGARLKNGEEGNGLGGHTWLTLDGTPYHEIPDDGWQHFTAMYVYPEESSPAELGINQS